MLGANFPLQGAMMLCTFMDCRLLWGWMAYFLRQQAPYYCLVVLAHNLGTQEEGSRRIISWRPAWATQWGVRSAVHLSVSDTHTYQEGKVGDVRGNLVVTFKEGEIDLFFFKKLYFVLEGCINFVCTHFLVLVNNESRFLKWFCI